MIEIIILVAAVGLLLAAFAFYMGNKKLSSRRDSTVPIFKPSGTETPTEIGIAQPEQAEQAPVDETTKLDVVTPHEVRPSLEERLGKTKGLFHSYLPRMLGRAGIPDATLDELEEVLVLADVGIKTTNDLLETLKRNVKESKIKEPSDLIGALRMEIESRLNVGSRELNFGTSTDNATEKFPTVWLFVGVNGVGKTTTIGKLAKQQIENGKKVLLAAGDTFRAAAADQLEMWADRVGADIVRGREGGDPSSVIYDAVQKAFAKGYDLVLADTAGRLHTKVNLMEELKKVRRVASKEPAILTEVLLVIDATTGQNGVVQASEFKDATELTGVVLTKLDGTAKGGVVLQIAQTLNLPVKLVGIGEGDSDLISFDPAEFTRAILS